MFPITSATDIHRHLVYVYLESSLSAEDETIDDLAPRNFTKGLVSLGPKVCRSCQNLGARSLVSRFWTLALFSIAYTATHKETNGSVPQNGAPWKYNSWPPENITIPKGKDRLLTIIFQGRAVKLWGCILA